MSVPGYVRGYFVKLTAHERAHGDLARKAAQELETALLNMPGRRYGDEVGAAANDLANESVRSLQQQDIEYDERKGHGYAEGAILPPPHLFPVEKGPVPPRALRSCYNFR